MQKRLRIDTFGGLCVYCGDIPIITLGSRQNKVIQLFEYLIVHRGQHIPADELISMLLCDDNISNPSNTLKNLVYRLRKLLDEAGADGDSCIVFSRGAYYFPFEYQCDIDCEHFTELVKSIKTGDVSAEAAYEKCMQALSLYRGDFLATFTAEPWVMSESVKYQEMYCFLLKRAYAYASEHADFESLIATFHKASQLLPYDEAIQILYITCLFESNHKKEAFQQYENVIAILFNDLGIGPSKKLKDCYNKISGGIDDIVTSVEEVKNSISESEIEAGAYDCTLEAFKSLYQFIVRHMERSGQSSYLLLCTFFESNGDIPTPGKRMTKITKTLLHAVKASARRGDACARYSPSQYILMLMNITQENCDMVSGRIRYNFYKESKLNDVRLSFKAITAAELNKAQYDQPPVSFKDAKW